MPPARATPKRVLAAIMDDPPVLSRTLTPTAVRGIDAVEELVHVGLATVAATGALVPRLAQEVPSVENGRWRLFPDGRMETTWRLRPGGRWHDGTVVDVDDLLFTMQVVADGDVTEFRDPTSDLIESAAAADGATLVVRWRRPFIGADTLFTRGGPRGSGTLPMPRHVLERPYAEDPARFAQLPYWAQEFVGTGPFKLKEWVPGAYLLLGAHDGYVLGRPKVDEVEVRFIPDPNTVLSNVLAGTLQVTLGRGLNLDQAIAMRDQWRRGEVAVSPASWIMIWPQFLNPTPATLSDVRFRRAAAHAIDRQQLVDTLSFGLTSVAHSFLSPSEPEYPEVESSIMRYPYDPPRAAQLLEEVGYVRGADGGFRDRAGQRLGVEMRTSAGDTLRERLLLAVADDWQRVGMAVEPVVVPRQQAQDQSYFLTFPAFLLSRNPNTLGDLASLHSRAAGVLENNFRGVGGGLNFPRYRDPEFDALIERYFVTIPSAERLSIVRDILSQIARDVVAIGLFYSTDQNLIAHGLANVAGRSARSTETWNAHEWDLQ